MEVTVPDGQSLWSLKTYSWSPDTNQIGLNVTHWLLDFDAGPVQADGNEMAQDMQTKLVDGYRDVLPDECFFLGCELKRIAPTESSGYGSTATGIAGLNTTEPLPNQVSGLISWVSTDPSRHGRGRIYVPFPTVADMAAAQVPTADYTTRLQALATTYMAVNFFVTVNPAPNNFPVQLVILDKGPPYTYIIAGDGYGRTRFATQRRRGNYGAPNELPLWATLP